MLDDDVLVVPEYERPRERGLAEDNTVCFQDPLEELGGVRLLEPEVGREVVLVFGVADYEVLGC